MYFCLSIAHIQLCSEIACFYDMEKKIYTFYYKLQFLGSNFIYKIK